MKKIVVLILLFFVGSLPLLFQFTPTEIIKLKTFDYLIKEQQPSGYFTILNITEENIAEEGGYPLPRSRLAEIHVDLLNKGALGVGWVISFPQPDRLGGDSLFAEALSYGGSVIAMFENDNGIYPKTVGTVLLGDNTGGMLTKGVVQNIDILRNSADQGIAIAPVDIDQLVRRIPLLLKTPEGYVSAFGTEVMKVLAGTDTYIIKTNELGIEEITVQGLKPVKTDPLGRKWISWVDTPQTDLTEMNVNGKFVFVGITASGVMPQIATPVGLLEPHKIQAALSESILIENSPYIPEWSFIAELGIYMLSIICILSVLSYFGISLSILLGLSIFGSTALLGGYMINLGLLVDVTWTLIYQFISGSVVFYMRFREQWKLRQQIKGQFGTYISPEYVEMIVKDPSLMKLGGDRRNMSYLFADIVGFTPISEKYMQKDDPEGLVDLINHFLDEMTKVVLANGGTLDKYMGDCIMAWWNYPIPCDNHAEMAVKTSIELELLCEDLNKKIKEKGLDLPPVMFGSGINTGECIVGNMGSELRMNLSVIGDSVNLGARLESQTRSFNTPILLSEHTYKEIQDDIPCKKLESIKVKGKEEPVVIYAPIINGKIRQLQKSP